MNEIESQYIRRTTASARAYRAFRATMPSGETRSVAYFPPYPVVIEKGSGSCVHDIDGNAYIDVLNNYTSLVHGNAHPNLTQIIAEWSGRGTVFPAPHPAQAELGEALRARYAAVEKVRFTNSGSEAATLAARIVRSVTRRRVIVRFAGGYHGTGETFADPSPEARVVPFNDTEALRQAVDGACAGVFIEPFLGSGGVVGAEREFLRSAEAFARNAGALIVLDEIQSLRNSYHGMHGALGLSPDLVLMGKFLGGGLPMGVVGGKAELLDRLSATAVNGLAHSGTFNGVLPAMASGLCALRMLDAAAIDQLNSRALHIQARLEAAGRSAGLDVTVTLAGSILHVHFLGDVPRNYADVLRGDRRLNKWLHLALLNEGVYSAPRGMLNLSTALTQDALEAVLRGYERAFVAVAALPEDAS